MSKMTKAEAYNLLSAMDRDVSWIANVFHTRRGRYSALNLLAMIKLLKAGKTLTVIPYTMPYKQICVDGVDVTPEEMRALAKEVGDASEAS